MSARAVAVLIASTLACGAVPARAQTPASTPGSAVADARQHFQRGIKFYKDADFRSALVEFQEAYRISPSYRLLFNIGQTFEELGDFAGALKALRDYEAQGGKELTKARRAEVQKDLARLAGHVATVELSVNEDGADVSIEGDRRVDLGKSPIASAVLLNGGDWTVRARKAGFEPVEARVTVAGGDKKQIALVLSPVPSAAPPVVLVPPPSAAPASPTPRSDVPPGPSKSPRTAAWVGVAVTGALGIATGVVGVVALGEKSSFDKTVDRFGATPDEVASARSKTRTWALATDVLGGATIAAAAVTVVLFLVHTSDAPKSGALRPYVGASGAGPDAVRTSPVFGAAGAFD